MPTKPSPCIQDHFAGLTDPRRRGGTYPLVNIVTIAICAVIYGADEFVGIAKFGRAKEEWLSQFLDLTEGIPSHDRFNAILAAIKPAEFDACLLSWITALHEITDGQIVAVDGKTLRRTALILLKNNHTLKVGVTNKRLAAGWDDAYLQQVLFGQ